MSANQEKFRNTFDRLHASPDVITKVVKMSDEKKMVPMSRKYVTSKIVAAAASICILAGSGAVVYARNVGGIQRLIQVWIHGDQTNATFTADNGSYTLDYTDKDGQEIRQAGGGVELGMDGSDRPLTADELMDYLLMPDVEYEDDGSVWVYYLSQKMEITDKFENGVCFVKLKANGETKYLTVKYEDGYSVSNDKFVQP